MTPKKKTKAKPKRVNVTNKVHDMVHEAAGSQWEAIGFYAYMMWLECSHQSEEAVREGKR